MKSRETWVAGGNTNTHYFHEMASKRNKANTIWFIRYGENNILTKYKDIQNVVV